MSGKFKKGHKGYKYWLGKKPWNFGLTKETDNRVANHSKVMRGRKLAEDTKLKIGKANKGNKRPDIKSGESSPSWKGEKAGYYAKHWWMKKEFGNPSKCAHCEIIGKFLKINSKFQKKRWNIDWANISRKYIRNRKDWLGLCRSCHKKYDAKR